MKRKKQRKSDFDDEIIAALRDTNRRIKLGLPLNIWDMHIAPDGEPTRKLRKTTKLIPFLVLCSILLCLLAPGCASPAPSILRTPSSLPPAANPGRWILVTAPAFADALQPLKKHRQDEGFDVREIKTTDLLTPDELLHHDGRKLLAQVRSLWQPDPAHSYVLLVGAVAAATADDTQNTTVPLFTGTVGRMKGQPTDDPYGCAPDELLPTVPVGRWPARSAAEARGMVEKTLAFESDGKTAPWRRSITLLVGSPGGHSATERDLANWFVNSLTSDNLERVHPVWTIRSVYHIPSSPWYVPDAALHDQALASLLQKQTFTFYAGHSDSGGFWSGGPRFLDRTDFARLDLPHGAGIFMSCSCDSCQFDPLGRADREGFALAALRNPAGPVAVIGATGSSYAAVGELAFEGMVRSLSTPQLPDRLGQCWLDVANGIANQPMDFLTFALFDFGDGTQGKVPLAAQRLEHLQMWTLLGDPALKLPDIAPELSLSGPHLAFPGAAITITGILPPGMDNARVRLTLECPAGTKPDQHVPQPPAGPDHDRALLANFAQAQNPVFASIQLTPTTTSFQGALALPNDVPWDHVIVRAVAQSAQTEALGIWRVDVLQPFRPLKLP